MDKLVPTLVEAMAPSVVDPAAEAVPPPPPPALPPLPLTDDPNDPSVLARLAVDALYARQSTTLAQASARYSLRTKRPPPPNYDLWFRFARDRKCLIDEYDQIQRDFKPFYQLAETHPAYFQEMIDLAARQKVEAWPSEMNIVEVRDGQAFHRGDTQYDTWTTTFEKFAALLPNMTFLLNARDEPRVAFNFRAPSARENALLRKDPTPFHIEPTSTGEFFRKQSGCLVPKEADGFMDGINEEHSFLVASAKPGYTTDLYPVLSMSKISPCFADILFPTEYYYDRAWWSAKYGFADNIPWDEKKPLLYWRGKSTGGRIIGDNYHNFMRFKLAEIGRANKGLMDVAITQVDDLVCRGELGCDAGKLAEEYNVTGEAAPREDAYGYKYLMDVDGESFSGRFLGLLRSGSLVFKATLFSEFFNDWLLPYEHYVPVKPDLSDLTAQVNWAIQNPEEARLIQQRGMEMAKRVMTDDQNDCYYLAVLLEWARLQDHAKGIYL
ncbi:glycosyl transferase family 90-domain-containing protein [Mycena maculata]|uniref:Glycosyl transferase family 90-domain-containing protein n=1 Tax=Mycena maculata TaxID=230809 RepID=A0AAD7N9U2_9AGAR|nr:glycosyl transferase family 90-domain-containing protein [Mycena maculata]